MTFKNRILWLILPLLLLPSPAFPATDGEDANEAYREGNYELAAELYRQAIDGDPENARLYFNLGNALAQLGNTEASNMAFERYRELTDDAGRQSLADYNIGKLYSDQDQLDVAAEHYREALIKNPGDEDARHNYELAKRLQKEQEQQDQQNEESSQDQQDENEQEESENGNDQQEDGGGQQDQGGENQQDSGGQDRQDSSGGEQQPQMSMEEAENILEALDQQERELLRNRQKEAENSITDDRNW